MQSYANPETKPPAPGSDYGLLCLGACGLSRSQYDVVRDSRFAPERKPSSFTLLGVDRSRPAALTFPRERILRATAFLRTTTSGLCCHRRCAVDCAPAAEPRRSRMRRRRWPASKCEQPKSRGARAQIRSPQTTILVEPPGRRIRKGRRRPMRRPGSHAADRAMKMERPPDGRGQQGGST